MKIKEIIKKIIPQKFHGEILAFPQIIRCLFARIFSPNKTILLCNWICQKNGKTITGNNWGDDLNATFIAESSGKRVLYYPNTKCARWLGLKNYVFIGSGLVARPQRNSIIWGTGFAAHNQGIFGKNEIVPADFKLKIAEKPKKILAVRGPLTREWLLKQGIDCPEIYGDPALLLPRFYEPKKLREHYKIGVIPHFYTLKNWRERVDKFIAKMPNAKLILIQGYKNWRDFIDEICACDFVVSESLHGLIASVAYGLPATWVEFGEHTNGWEFKFHDFYASLINWDKIPPPPCAMKISDETTLNELRKNAWVFPRGVIYEKTEALLSVCPFPLKKVPQNP